MKSIGEPRFELGLFVEVDPVGKVFVAQTGMRSGLYLR